MEPPKPGMMVSLVIQLWFRMLGRMHSIVEYDKIIEQFNFIIVTLFSLLIFLLILFVYLLISGSMIHLGFALILLNYQQMSNETQKISHTTFWKEIIN